MSDTYRLSKSDRILSGSHFTRRSAEKVAQIFIQGTEINQIGLMRSGLPILGRNPRYKIVDISLTGSLSDSNSFLDVESSSDAGLGQDVSTVNGIPVANVKFPDGRIKQEISFALGSEDFGYGKEHIDSVPFFDLAKYNAVDYINNDGPDGMFPIVGSYVSYDEKLSFNGIVEPFEIRRRALGLNIFLEEESQPGSVTGFNDPVITANSYDSRENGLRSEFFEDVQSKGFSRFSEELDKAQALLEAEFVSDFTAPQHPFVERDNADLLISDPEIESIQLGMDPTLDEGILPVTHVDMTVGFDAESRDRVNSIVFRGMTRR